MVHSSNLVAFAALLSSVQGHYSFVRVAHNGKWAAPLQYVRNHTHDYWEESTPGGYSNRPRTYDWWVNPVDRPESMRCGRDNMAWANTTEVLSVRAGDQMEFAQLGVLPFQWTDRSFNDCPEGRGTCNEEYTPYVWFHSGPVVVHISRVPDGQDVNTYDGAGEWIKIHTLGVEYRENTEPEPVFWLPRNRPQDAYAPDIASNRIIFNLPKEIPKGQYLLRAANVWHTGTYTYQNVTGHGEAQLYHSCAQLQVDSDATGSLPKGVLIPEAFQYDQPGMVVSLEMYNNKKVDEDYIYPGGPLWTGKELVEDKPSR